MEKHAKFLFTKNLSDAIFLIGQMGKKMSFSLDDLSYSDISVFFEMHNGVSDYHNLLENSIERGRHRYKITSQVWLPPLISKSKDVNLIYYFNCSS